MNIGRLRHRFLLQQPSGTSGYEDVAKVRGALEPTSTGEALKFATPTAQAQWRIRIRHRSDVKGDWQIVERDEHRTFQIVGLLPDLVAGELLIVAVEGPQ